MAIIYKLVTNPFTDENDIINKIDGNRIMSIPMVDSNTDYQEYLKWTKASPMNVAEEAE